LYHVRERFDYELLDPEDPFEIDAGNRPHLYKHLPLARGRSVAVGVEELYDIFVVDNPLFYPAKEDGAADWLMVGEVPGLVLVVPLARSNSGGTSTCRPIGIYSAPGNLRQQYEADLR
jgi:hypothetical protein